MDKFIDIRVFYKKRGRIKYISHLDMNRCMQRALVRTGLPCWHTEGFNPHLYLTFALPLSLGYESDCEIMDFRLTEEIDLGEVQNRLNAVLPEGLEVYRVALKGEKFDKIVSADYTVELYEMCIRDSLKPLGHLSNCIARTVKQRYLLYQRRL